MAIEDWEVSRLFSDLIKRGDSNSTAVACMLCPEKILENAAQLAQDDMAFGRIEICQGLSVYRVKEYMLIPGRFCSCHYFQETVVRMGTGWTCKHDLGLRLRIALRRNDSVRLIAGGKNELLKYLVR